MARRLVLLTLSTLWVLWFTIKVLLGTFVLHQDVFGDITHRIRTACTSSSFAVLCFMSFVRSSFLTVLDWTDVFLPFVQDTLMVTRKYVWPFAYARVLLPVYHVTVPVWRWFNETVPLEYRLVLLSLLILAWAPKIDPFLKTYISVFLPILVVYRWISIVLLNHYVMFVVFVLVPLGLSVHAVAPVGSFKPSSNRLVNLLMYLVISPLIIYMESGWSFMSTPLVGVVVCPGSYAFMASWLYWLDSDWFLRDFRYFSNRAGFARRIGPLVGRLLDVARERIPWISKLGEKVAFLRQTVTMNSVALLGAQNASLTMKLVTLVKSTPFLVIVLVAIIVLLGVLYWLHSALASLMVVGIWPWWFYDTLKICLYDRKEDYKRQLAFSLLLIALEVYLFKQKNGFVQFVLNLFHLPLIVVIRMAPLFVMSLVTKLSGYVPLLLVSPLKRKQSALDRKKNTPVEAISASPDEKSSTPPSEAEPSKRKSSLVKRRSAGCQKS